MIQLQLFAGTVTWIGAVVIVLAAVAVAILAIRLRQPALALFGLLPVGFGILALAFQVNVADPPVLPAIAALGLAALGIIGGNPLTVWVLGRAAKRRRRQRHAWRHPRSRRDRQRRQERHQDPGGAARRNLDRLPGAGRRDRGDRRRALRDHRRRHRDQGSRPILGARCSRSAGAIHHRNPREHDLGRAVRRPHRVAGRLQLMNRGA